MPTGPSNLDIRRGHGSLLNESQRAGACWRVLAPGSSLCRFLQLRDYYRGIRSDDAQCWIIQLLILCGVPCLEGKRREIRGRNGRRKQRVPSTLKGCIMIESSSRVKGCSNSEISFRAGSKPRNHVYP